MSIASVLDAAADELERHGWQQGTSENPVEPTCAYEAICRVSGRRERESAADYFRKWTLLGRSISDWNDTPGRTKTDVLDALRRTAKRAPSKERNA